MEIEGKVMAIKKEKGRRWDGRSRPSDDKYRKNFDRIFGKSTSELLEEIEVKEKTLHEELMEGFEKEQEELKDDE